MLEKNSMALYYKYVEEYLQYSLISIAGKSKFSLEKYTRVERLLKEGPYLT
jgi:hypothetical protein